MRYNQTVKVSDLMQARLQKRRERRRRQQAYAAGFLFALFFGVAAIFTCHG